MLESSLASQLTRLLGASTVSTGNGYEIDGLTPEAVVRPVDQVQLAEVLRWASSEQVSLLPRGGGTRASLGNVPRKADVILDMGAFNQLVDYQPADMTATVEAGLTLSSMQQQLALGGEFVPLESAQAERSTVGGILSIGSGGPLSHTYGLPREWLIGIRVMTPQGISTKAGGKVVKNVTGYDLNKLYTGSLGTLGVILEASFKLLPRNPRAGALMVSFPTVAASIDAGRKLLYTSAAPLGLHCASSGVARWLRDSVQSDLRDLQVDNEDFPLCLSYFSGRDQATKRRMDEAAAILVSEGAISVQRIEGDAANGILRQITDAPAEINPGSKLVIKVSIQSKLAALVSSECTDITVLGHPPDQLTDPGFGSIRLFWPKSNDDSNSVSGVDQPALEAIQKIRRIAQHYGGSSVVEHCPLDLKRQIDVWGDPPDSLKIMQAIKKHFDPDDILNPGRFLGGI